MVIQVYQMQNFEDQQILQKIQKFNQFVTPVRVCIVLNVSMFKCQDAGLCLSLEASGSWAVSDGTWPCVFWPAGPSATSASGKGSGLQERSRLTLLFQGKQRNHPTQFRLQPSLIRDLFHSPTVSGCVLHCSVPLCDAAGSPHQRGDSTWSLGRH